MRYNDYVGSRQHESIDCETPSAATTVGGVFKVSMRKKAEILEAEGDFFDRVWYNRKLVMLDNIKNGIEEMPPEEIMNGMTDHMRRIETEHPGEELLYDDFEWGMINGKLSALRWVMGDDWDMLDT